MSVLHINKHNFSQEVMESDKIVLLDFWAPWCAPCQMLSPTLDAIAQERPDIKVCKVNVDEEHSLAGTYKVVSIPTLMVLQNGVVEDRVVGVRPKQDILDMLG